VPRIIKTSDRKPEGVDFGDTMARLPTRRDGTKLLAADIASIRLRVFDRKNPRTEIWSTDLAPASTIYASYQLNDRWDIDTIGFDFLHYLSLDLVFAGDIKEAGGHTYRLEYYLVTKAATGMGRILIEREVYVVPAFSPLPPADTGGGGNTPDFTLSIVPQTQQVNAGSSVTYTVSNLGTNGFVGQIDLTVAPVIPGVTYILDLATISNDSSTTLRVFTDGSVVPAGYTIVVTGTSGLLVHQAAAGLDVLANAGDFSIIANPPSVTVEEGDSIDVSISSTAIAGFTGTISYTVGPPLLGVTYSINPPSVIVGNTATLTIDTIVGAASGGPVIATLTITGTSGLLVHTTTTLLQIDPAGTGSTGWTTFTATSGTDHDTRKVYCSSSTGNDGNSGLDDTHPKLTLSAACALIRDGFPDWLLLKSGDTFTGHLSDGTPNSDYWRQAGYSASEKILISTYTPGNAALTTFGARAKIDSTYHGSPPYEVACMQTWNQQSNGHYVGNLAIVNIEFTSTAYDGTVEMRGVQFYGGGPDILVEGCYFHRLTAGLIFGSDGHGGAGRLSRVIVRRNIIADNFRSGANGLGSQGLYMSDTDGALIEQNCIDCNGWSEFTGQGDPSQFRRNVYIQNACTGLVFRQNLVSRSDGIQLRPGGDLLGNFFYKNAINLQFGSGNEPETGGVNGLIKGNVIIDGNNIGSGPDDGRGTGISMGNVVGSAINPAVVTYNIIAHNVTGDRTRFNVMPLLLNFDNGHGNPNGMHHVTFDHNIIYDWSCIGRQSLVGWYTTQQSPQGYPLEEIAFSYNDLQSALAADQAFPIIDFVTTTINVPPEIHSDHNRIHRKNDNQTADNMFKIRGTSYKFDAYMALVGDSTSRYVEITPGGGADQYPDPASGLPEYDLSVGGAGTVAHFFAQARLNSKVSWVDTWTAAPVCAFFQANFGMVVPP